MLADAGQIVNGEISGFLLVVWRFFYFAGIFLGEIYGGGGFECHRVEASDLCYGGIGWGYGKERTA
jgi:hypothetical protein